MINFQNSERREHAISKGDLPKVNDFISRNNDLCAIGRDFNQVVIRLQDVELNNAITENR